MVSVTIWMFLVLTLHGLVSGDKSFKKTPGKPRIKTNDVHHVYRPYINGEVLNITKVQHLEGINRHHPPFNERRIHANSFNKHSVHREGKSLQSNKGTEFVFKVDTEDAQKDIAYHGDKEPEIPLDDQSRGQPQLPGWLRRLGAAASKGRFPSAGEINGYNIAPDGGIRDGKIIVSLPKSKEMSLNKVAYSNGAKETKTVQRHKPEIKNDFLSNLSPELELMPMVLEADQSLHLKSKNSSQTQEPKPDYNNPDSSVQRQAPQMHQNRKENRPQSNTRNNPNSMRNFQPEEKNANKELSSIQDIHEKRKHEKHASTANGKESPESIDKSIGTVVEEFTNEQPGLTPDLTVGGEEYDRILLGNDGKQTKDSVPDDEDEKHVENNLPLSKKYEPTVQNNQGIQKQYHSETDESRGYLPSQGNLPEKRQGIQNGFLGDDKMPVDFRGHPDVSPDSLPHARPHDRGNYEQRREQPPESLGQSLSPIAPDPYPPNMGRSLQVGTGQDPGHLGEGRSIPYANHSPPKPDYEELKRKMINELKFPQAINRGPGAFLFRPHLLPKDPTPLQPPPPPPPAAAAAAAAAAAEGHPNLDNIRDGNRDLFNPLLHQNPYLPHAHPYTIDERGEPHFGVRRINMEATWSRDTSPPLIHPVLNDFEYRHHKRWRHPSPHFEQPHPNDADADDLGIPPTENVRWAPNTPLPHPVPPPPPHERPQVVKTNAIKRRLNPNSNRDREPWVHPHPPQGPVDGPNDVSARPHLVGALRSPHFRTELIDESEPLHDQSYLPNVPEDRGKPVATWGPIEKSRDVSQGTESLKSRTKSVVTREEELKGNGPENDKNFLEPSTDTDFSDWQQSSNSEEEEEELPSTYNEPKDLPHNSATGVRSVSPGRDMLPRAHTQDLTYCQAYGKGTYMENLCRKCALHGAVTGFSCPKSTMINRKGEVFPHRDPLCFWTCSFMGEPVARPCPQGQHFDHYTGLCTRHN